MSTQETVKESPQSAAANQTLGTAEAAAKVEEDAGTVPETESATEEAVLDLLLAANVMEDWEGLRDLMAYSARRKPEVVILTNIILNPLNEEEKAAFRHANRYLTEAYTKDGNFSDITLFIESFRGDAASDVVAVSARQIMHLIDEGKKRLQERFQTLADTIKACPCPCYIVPGQFEDVDMVRSLGPAGLAERYITVKKVTVKGFNIVGIGGLPVFSEDCPLVFQEREYFDGTPEADDFLREAIGSEVDLLVSQSPIKHYTDPGEEVLVREFISQYLPGKLIVTAQSLGDYQKSCVAASGAEIIRGGHYGKGKDEPAHLFWELLLGKKSLEDKSLFELKGRKAFRLL